MGSGRASSLPSAEASSIPRAGAIDGGSPRLTRAASVARPRSRSCPVWSPTRRARRPAAGALFKQASHAARSGAGSEATLVMTMTTRATVPSSRACKAAWRAFSPCSGEITLVRRSRSTSPAKSRRWSTPALISASSMARIKVVRLAGSAEGAICREPAGTVVFAIAPSAASSRFRTASADAVRGARSATRSPYDDHASDRTSPDGSSSCRSMLSPLRNPTRARASGAAMAAAWRTRARAAARLPAGTGLGCRGVSGLMGRAGASFGWPTPTLRDSRLSPPAVVWPASSPA